MARHHQMKATLQLADDLFGRGLESEAFDTLRRLSIDGLGELLLRVPDQFGHLKARLPEMPDDEVQVSWTGTAGRALLQQSCAFVRSVEAGFLKHVGRSLDNVTILDYGCGWGRHMRLMYRFSSPAKIYGVDASDRSIELCRQHRVLGNLALCEYVPQTLPFEGIYFDLVYAFSVFTHLSEKTMYCALRAIRARIKEDGLLVVTVRPVEYWDRRKEAWLPGKNATDLKAEHLERGFAFVPHNWEPIDGDITYGDSSISIEYVQTEWKDWELVEHNSSSGDPFQTILFLLPR